VEEAQALAAKVLHKTMDTPSPDAEKLEFGMVTRLESGEVVFRHLKAAEVDKLMKDNAPKDTEGAAASS